MTSTWTGRQRDRRSRSCRKSERWHRPNQDFHKLAHKTLLPALPRLKGQLQSQLAWKCRRNGLQSKPKILISRDRLRWIQHSHPKRFPKVSRSLCGSVAGMLPKSAMRSSAPPATLMHKVRLRLDVGMLAVKPSTHQRKLCVEQHARAILLSGLCGMVARPPSKRHVPEKRPWNVLPSRPSKP